MFAKKKEERPKRNHSGNLSQYGLFDVPTDLSMDNDMDDDGEDSDLEAELLALTKSSSKPKKPARKKVAPSVNLDAMVAQSLKDIPSDEEVSGDDDDPELLDELNDIAGEERMDTSPIETDPLPPAQASVGDITKLLEERLKMYETAETNAKQAGESGRARRFNRGQKTLKDLIKQAKAGKPINNEDIPPEVSVALKKPPSADDTTPILPSRPAPTVPKSEPVVIKPTIPQQAPEESNLKSDVSSENLKIIQLLTKRRDEYKIAALKAKKVGNKETAINYIKISKQCDLVMKTIEDGQPVDLSKMPGPPEEVKETPKIEENQIQTHSDSPQEIVEVEADEPEPNLIQASSVLEALQQRLELYKNQEESAKEQGNSSKARRMGRIVKQFEQAIKLHNAGKPVPFDELPTPPGYAPIPGTEQHKPEPTDIGSPTPALQENTGSPKRPQPPQRQNSARASGNHLPTTRMEKQIEFLLARQKEFKVAALNAKKKGEMEEAKEYLRNCKRIEPLIEASRGGMPVDLTSLPLPPSVKSKLDLDFDLVMKEECQESDAADIDIMHRLENQLTKQLKMCLSTRDHHKALGDIAGMNRFERLAVSVTKDLDYVRLAKRTPGAAVPKFHYENKEFSIVKSFTDLNDNDLELNIVRGINYNCTNPKDIDTYVRYEFPFPQEEPVRDKTSTFKDTNNPEYNHTVVLPIQRTARPCLRVFKRHSIKFEIYSKGGFFRSDALMGTVNVKLQQLETQCEIHDSFELMDGRKKVGGKLEIRLRVRDPLLTKQVEQLSEKWLILDH